jgi:hypothetical protein
MAQQLQSNLPAEERNALRITEAVYEIAASPNLRYFVRSLLNNCGINATPQAVGALELARQCGRHEIGMEIQRILLQELPGLYPSLIKEDQDEQTAELAY